MYLLSLAPVFREAFSMQPLGTPPPPPPEAIMRLEGLGKLKKIHLPAFRRTYSKILFNIVIENIVDLNAKCEALD
jgi:hypothetical protein